MSRDIDSVLSACPDYVEWSNCRLHDNQNHYDNDPDYQRWADSFSDDGDGEPLGFEPLSDEDWEAVLDEWTRIPLGNPIVATAEEQAFFDTYCL